MGKSIGLYQGIALYIAAILGSGILFLSGVTASMAGPASILSWLIMGVVNLPIAYSFAGMAREFPDAGGAVTFVRKAFGGHAGNLVGWLYFVTAAVGQSIVSLTGAYYAAHTFALSLEGTFLVAAAILFIAGIANFYGLNVSGKMALALSTILFILLLAVIVFSLPAIEWHNFKPFMPEGWFSVGSAITVIFWSFFGWEAICSLAGHFKRPETDIVKSGLISALIIGVLFVLLSFVTIGTATYGDAVKDLSPVGVMMERAMGIGGKTATAVLAFMICIGTANAFIASLVQLGYSLSLEKAFPAVFSKVSRINGVPRRMVVFICLFALAVILVTVFMDWTFQDLLFIPTSIGIWVYILSMASGLKLFKRGRLIWWLSLLSFLICVIVLPFFKVYLLVPLFVACLYMLYMMKQKKKENSDR